MKHLYMVLCEKPIDNVYDEKLFVGVKFAEEDWKTVNRKKFINYGKYLTQIIFDKIEDTFWAENTPYKTRGEFMNHVKNCEGCETHIESVKKVWGIEC